MVLGGLAAACGGAEEPPRPNLILVTIDTLRADHLGAWGHGNPTSPAIDRMAAEGVRFALANSQAPWTLPSMASVHTGLYPLQHGADADTRALPEDAWTLAESLRRAGYHTGAVISHVFLSHHYGFEQGFDLFDESNVRGHEAVTSEAVTRTALKRIEELPEPFFLWVHYFDPHFTYVQHPEFGFCRGYQGNLRPPLTVKRLRRLEGRPVSKVDLAFIQNVYDEEIAFTDRCIGELWDGLRERFGAERCVLALTGDHGEYFLERERFFHGKDVYQALVHVPLVLTGAIPPALRGTVVEGPVETRDLARTLLGLVGKDGEFGGTDLLKLGPEGPTAPVFSEGSHAAGPEERKLGVVLGGWKLIHRLDDDGYELYSLADDPDERDDRWNPDAPPSGAPIEALLRGLTEFARQPRLEPRDSGIDMSMMNDLDDLGYGR